jgi:hypothetical protein
VCVAVAGPLGAQSTQYIAPGTLGAAFENRRDAIRSALESARWHLGAVRVEPWISLREIAWVEERNPDGSTRRDLTATAGAGLTALLPVGGRTTLVAQALPEYVWWRDRSEDRRLAGRYGAGVFVYGGRLSLELTGRSTDSTTQATAELDRRVQVKDDRAELRVELPLGHELGVFARGAFDRYSTGDHDQVPGLAALDRDESWWVGGVRWSPFGDFSIGVGGGTSQARFDAADAARSNHGTTTYAELRLDRPKLQASVEGYRTKLESDAGSSFEGFDGDLATARVRWEPRRSFSWSVYGSRNLSWSILGGSSFYIDQRIGTEIGLKPGWRTSFHAFYESGEHRYGDGATAGDPADRRTDDVTSAGVGGRFDLGRGLSLEADARRTRVENRALGVDNDFNELRFGVALGVGGRDLF